MDSRTSPMMFPGAANAGTTSSHSSANMRISFRLAPGGSGDGRVAVHRNHLAGEVGSPVACQHQCNLRNFVRLPKVFDGLPAESICKTLLILPIIFAQHGLDQT